MIAISTVQEISLFNLDGKWNDYIGVQKEVLQVLRKENYFVNNEIVNISTGMSIKINAKGIKETIGKGKRFQNLPKRLKVFKISTIRHLKEIMQHAELIVDNVENVHEKNGYMFAYFSNEVNIDGILTCVRITIMKKVSSNWFWIHNIDEKKF